LYIQDVRQKETETRAKEPFTNSLGNSLFLYFFKKFLRQRGKAHLLSFYLFIERYKAVEGSAKLEIAKQIQSHFLSKKSKYPVTIRKELKKGTAKSINVLLNAYPLT
jgi:hypothetical protein